MHIQIEPRYCDFVQHSVRRRGRNDSLHIQRSLESFPHLYDLVPAEILARFA